jgi:hypothetical protein
VDGQCVLGLPEFLDFLRGQKEEAVSRIKELTEMSVMSIKSSPGTAYSPPKEGFMYLDIIDGYMRKNKAKVLSGVDQSHILEVAKDEPGNKVNMLVYSLINSKLRLREAWEMYEIIFGELRDKAKTLEKLLPHMYDAKDARTLLFKVSHSDVMYIHCTVVPMSYIFHIVIIIRGVVWCGVVWFKRLWRTTKLSSIV